MSAPTATMTPPADAAQGPSFPEILRAAQQGDGWALEHLFHLLSGRIRAFLTARGLEDPEASASEVFVRAFRAIADFEGDQSAYEAWIFTIARRLAIDEHRRAERRPHQVEDDQLAEREAPDDVEVQAVEQLDQSDAQALLDGLSPDQREVVVLRIIAGLSTEQVSEILDKRPDAVRALQHRGLANIRRRISP
ncbi:MAG: RNA polymerase sigma factor [Acidimicrobiia bacterium]|nr:RNA polymerase sigma factor [Acidimicrobiia bacterium]